MNRIVTKLIEASILCGVIKEEDKALYNIAITSLFFSIFTWSSLILLGIVFHEVYGSLIFLVFHIPLRIYAGGYHQNTRTKCYLQSLIIFGLLMVGALSVIKIRIVNRWTVLMVLSLLVIWIFAPVESLNKPLNPEERKHHKRTARIIFLIEFAVLVIFKVKQSNTSLYYSTMSIVLVAIQLIFGIVEQKLVNHQRMKT